MISLSDRQLDLVITAAAAVQPDRRGIFLERVGAMLTLRGRFSDADVGEIVGLAKYGLVMMNEVRDGDTYQGDAPGRHR
jgi:hypothetical protein